MSGPASAILEKARSRDYWAKICPLLTVGEPAVAAPSGRPLADLEVFQINHRLIHDGYYHVPDVIPRRFVDGLAAGIANLRRAGIPPIFCVVYDQFWTFARYFERLLAVALGTGFVMLPGTWCWLIEPDPRDAGWAPHRDRALDTLFHDGRPQCLSVWVPLTDATTTNGCIHVIPAYLDADYQARRLTALRPRARDARAVPATAGSFLCWTQALVHWGGRSSDLATGPRISVGLEFQRRDVAPFDHPVLETASVLSLERRLAFVGKYIFNFWGRAKLPEAYLEVAIRLAQDLAGSPSGVSAPG